jgi:hypothetical protein
VSRHGADRPHQEKGDESPLSGRDKFESAAWQVMVAEKIIAERLMFVDECGTHTSLAPLYSCAPRGERSGARPLGYVVASVHEVSDSRLRLWCVG